MSKNIPNRKTNGNGHTQGASALFTMTAFLAKGARAMRIPAPAKGRFEHFDVVRAEAQVRTARWGA